MTQIVYGRSKPRFTGPRQWKNGRHFQGVTEGAKAVFLDGDFPAIRKAYEAAGVVVHDGLPHPLDHDGSGKAGGDVAAVPKPRGRRKARA